MEFLMSNLSTSCRPAEFEPSWDESCGIFDPAPIPVTDGAKKIAKLIDDDAAWLQAEPRSSLGIVLRLFPGAVRGLKDALLVIDWLGDYLWDAGYTPRWTIPSTVNWDWHEGKPLRKSRYEANNAKWTIEATCA